MNSISKFAVVFLVVGAMLLAGPVFGFGSIAADRGVTVGISENEGLVGFEPAEDPEKVNSGAGNVFVGEIHNNIGGQMELVASVENDGLQIDNEEDLEQIEESEAVEISCNGQGRDDNGPITIVIESATVPELGVTVEGASMNIDTGYNCGGGGGGNPGPGFDSISAESVSGYVQPGEERQTFRFALAGNRQPNEEIEIDLTDPRDNGVNYDQTFWDGDIRIESGRGSVWTDGNNNIVYQVSSQDKRGDEIVISAGSYSTDGAGGPYDVSFTRVDSGETGIDQFQIDGEDGAGDPFTNVTAEDIPGNAGENGERQTFRFTAGQKITAYETVEIDLSETDRVGYSGDVQIEEGAGSIWKSGDTIVYQAAPSDYAGEEIVVSIGLDDTDASGGPYTTTFTRTDTGDQDIDSFEIG